MTHDPRGAIELDRAFVWHPYQPTDAWLGRTGIPVVVGAQGEWLELADGRRVVDGFSSWWTSILGHSHPRVVAALEAQLRRLDHFPIAGAVTAESAELAAALVGRAPAGLARAFFSDDGSTAVEVAVRAAFQFWQQNGAPGRTTFVSFADAYHGDTIGAVSVGGVELFHRMWGPLCFATLRAPAPAADEDAALDALGRLLASDADRVAAVVLEPLVQGAAGMRFHSPEFVRGVRELCDGADVFLIADEVFVGLGRLGSVFASSLAGVTPDFVCLAKGLGGGAFPFAATLTTERVFDGFRGGPERTFFYGHSFCGNPMGCAGALATLELLDDTLLERVGAIEAQLRVWLTAIEALGVARAPRARGALAAFDLDVPGGYLADAGPRIAAAALERGAFVRPLGSVVYLAPPLTIGDDALAVACDAVTDAVRAVCVDEAPRNHP